MYGFTAKQIKTKGIISLIVAVIFLIVSIFAGEGLSVSGGGDAIYILLLPLVIAWQVMAILLNWKKMLKGFILPIPVVSYVVETCKALFIMVPKALFWSLTHKDA